MLCKSEGDVFSGRRPASQARQGLQGRTDTRIRVPVRSCGGLTGQSPEVVPFDFGK